MECTKAEELICRSIDGALPDPERAELEKHVHECTACGAFRDDLARQDRELRAAFEGPRGMAAAIADRTIAALRREAAPKRRSWTPFLLPLAAAAGFLVAIVGFPRERVREVTKEVRVKDPFTGGQEVTPVKQPTGKIVLTTGEVLVCPKDDPTWYSCRLNPVETFEMGTIVRCAPNALAEIETSEGSRVRLAGGTEVQFIANRNLRLVRGELMSKIAASRSGMPYRVTTDHGALQADQATVDVACAERVASAIVVEGTARFAGRDLRACQRVAAIDGKCGERLDDLRDAIMETRWVHPLLLRAGHEEELAARVTKMIEHAQDAPYEQEIRSLGEQAGPALLRCLGEDGKDPARRRIVAKLASDLAGPRSVPDLIDLLNDKDADIRVAAFDGLVRLTGQNFGQKRSDWQTSVAGCGKPEHEAWQRWLKEAEKAMTK